MTHTLTLTFQTLVYPGLPLPRHHTSRTLLTTHSPFPGVLFICFNVDHRLLWGTITEDTVKDGFQFYETFYNSPPAIKVLIWPACLHALPADEMAFWTGSSTRDGWRWNDRPALEAAQMG